MLFIRDIFYVTAVRHQQHFNDYLRMINKDLAYIQFELRGCRNQYDGDVYYGIVNTIADEQSKLGTNYSIPQIAFFKAVVSSSLDVVVLASLFETY